MAASIQKVGPAIPIQCHAWSSDRQTIAVSHNDKLVELYKQQPGGSWNQTDILDQHDLRVNDIDWAPNTNRIVTCSADRNAYVWVQGADGKWKHTLVLLRINRAATCVRWSPQENKFAVGSGARIISICYLDEEKDWWVAKHIRKPLRSTITTVDWHPNNILLAAGCTDFKVRVFSTYIKEIEPKPSATEWGAKMPFANLMAEFSNSPTGGGWIHAVAFNEEGTRLAWVGHDSSIAVADAPSGMVMMKLKTNLLPFLSLLWIGPNRLLAAGHDCVPVLFHVDSAGKVSQGPKLEEGGNVVEATAAASAKNMFKNKDRLGQELVDSRLGTTHQNQINSMRILEGNKVEARRVSTTAGDGALVIWNLASGALAVKLTALKI
eukprot:TRINITY_DN1772_c0_g1_i2.p1 TRINITY_DN1772_c0_g1~~TRINITY_DN1772_c0_g1_i2.p1  ORF type:complete len:379 (+),score=104.26 TRINITY_DN1772_c0_g1_i2:191-1327(+)